MSNLNPVVTIDEAGETILSEEVSQNENHTLRVSANCDNNYVLLEFSSRQSLYDFARSLLHEAVFGRSGATEFAPLLVDDSALVVNGVRLTESSYRIFVTHSEIPEDKP